MDSELLRILEGMTARELRRILESCKRNDEIELAQIIERRIAEVRGPAERES